MKSALIAAAAVVAILGGASPALACRIAPPIARAEAAMPRVGFTAQVASSTRAQSSAGTETIAVTLDTRRTLTGTPPAQAILYGVVSDEIVISGCAPVRPYPHQLTELIEGETVVVSGVESPEAGLIIQAVAPVSSERGRALLAALGER